jgi:hypothetical protein
MQSLVAVTPDIQSGPGAATGAATAALSGNKVVAVWSGPSGVQFQLISDAGGTNPVVRGSWRRRRAFFHCLRSLSHNSKRWHGATQIPIRMETY